MKEKVSKIFEYQNKNIATLEYVPSCLFLLFVEVSQNCLKKNSGLSVQPN